MFNRFLLCIYILFISTSALADQRIEGHMTPLPNELLDNPVTLDCGITVQEVRGNVNFNKINSMCTYAYTKFWKFITKRGIETNGREGFFWNISFIPEGSCYRCLNDDEFRFKYRNVKGPLVGYTDRDQRYAFMLSNSNDAEFNVTFVHELFHSMSMYYGIYDNHPGNWSEKTLADEILAEEFTEWIGYGR
jgi:hypothetical protein